MRSFWISTVLCCCTVLNSASAQTQTFSFDWKDAPLEDCVSDVEEAAGVKVYYLPKWFAEISVTKKLEAETLDEIFSQLFDGLELFYFIDRQSTIITTFPVMEALQFDEGDSRETLSQFSRELADEDLIILGSRKRSITTAKISGRVVDENGKGVIGATLYVGEADKSTVSGADGNYELTLPVGKHAISVNSVGFESQTLKVLLNSNGNLEIALEEEAIVLDEIAVIAGVDKNVTSTLTGLTSLGIEDIKTVPKLFGENDVVQVALALPGVQSVGEGASGINVRGGKTDQNLVLFNNATIYNPFHFFGFFSAFNSDITGSTDLYKGSIPVTYGGRLSAILDVKRKKGDTAAFSGRAGISPATSSFGFNIPVLEKTSVVVGARGTYSNWITRLVDNETIKNSDPQFFDVALGIDHTFNEKHTLGISGYYSYDQFRITPDSLFSYSNTAISGDWKYLVNDKLDFTTILAYSEYNYDIENEPGDISSFNFGFGIKDFYAKTFATYQLKKHTITAGADYRSYDLTPGFIRPAGSASEVESESLQNENGIETSFFLSDDFSINDKLSLSVGLRYSQFSTFGPRTINFYADNQVRSTSTITSTEEFEEGERIDQFGGLEERLSLNYLLGSDLSIKVNYTSMRQYIHSLSNTVSVSPLDTWKLSDPNVLPQVSRQYSAGVFKNLMDNSVELSLEFYYKNFDNILDYKSGANLALNPVLEQDILQGDGRSRGVEFLLRKKSGKLTGWLGYTYSRSEQRFLSEFSEELINGGQFFPSNFDKPHDLSIISNYKINRRVSVSSNIIFASGRPVTYPTAKYNLSGREVVHFGDRNAFRIPNYFRTDIGLNIEPSHKLDKRFYTTISFSIYNLLGRDNVYSVFFRNDAEGDIQGFELSVLASPIPSITYNIIF